MYCITFSGFNGVASLADLFGGASLDEAKCPGQIIYLVKMKNWGSELLNEDWFTAHIKFMHNK